MRRNQLQLLLVSLAPKRNRNHLDVILPQWNSHALHILSVAGRPLVHYHHQHVLSTLPIIFPEQISSLLQGFIQSSSVRDSGLKIKVCFKLSVAIKGPGESQLNRRFVSKHNETVVNPFLAIFIYHGFDDVFHLLELLVRIKGETTDREDQVDHWDCWKICKKTEMTFVLMFT